MSLTKILSEELNKTDKDEIESMIDDMLEDYKDELEEEVREMIEDTDTEDMIKQYIADAFEQYHQTLWQRRGRWSGAIKRS